MLIGILPIPIASLYHQLNSLFHCLPPNVARRDGRYSFARPKEYPENAPGLRGLKFNVEPFIDLNACHFAPDPNFT